MIDLELETKQTLLEEGYCEIMNENFIIPSPTIVQRKHPSTIKVLLLLHENNVDIKILLFKTVRGFTTREELFEITKEEATSNHPVLKTIKKIDFLNYLDKKI